MTAEKHRGAADVGGSKADRESATEQIGHVLDLFSSEWLTNEARSFELDTDIDRFAVARLGLFSACWLSRSSSAEILDVHEANLIYLDREKIKPLLEEMVILLRSTVTEHQTIPGWVWVKSLNEDDIVKNLRNFVVYGRSTGVRKEALSLLADLKVPLAVGVIEGFNFTDTLVAESDKDVAAAACDYLGTVGAEDILPLLESIEGSQAQLLRLRILMRTRPDEAVREVDDVKGNSDKVRAAVEEQIGTLEEKSVRRLLSSARADIRCTALKELATRGVLIEAEARSALDDPSVTVRASALEVLIRLGASGIDSDLIRGKASAEAPTLFEALIRPNEEDLILALFRKASYEQLNDKLGPLRLDAAIAYRVLAEDHFVEFEHILRDDLASEFESRYGAATAELRELVLGKLPDLPETEEVRSLRDQIDKLISDHLDPKTKNFSVSNLLASALWGLAKNGTAGDAQVGRNSLASEYDFVRSAAVAVLFNHGSSEDSKLLVEIAKTKWGETSHAAAKAAIRLSPGPTGAALRLLESGDAALVQLALAAWLTEDLDAIVAQVRGLLSNDNSAIRVSALAFLVKRLSREQLESLLGEYTSLGTYYYNVVAHLDRILFAPGAIGAHFERCLLSEGGLETPT